MYRVRESMFRGEGDECVSSTAAEGLEEVWDGDALKFLDWSPDPRIRRKRISMVACRY